MNYPGVKRFFTFLQRKLIDLTPGRAAHRFTNRRHGPAPVTLPPAGRRIGPRHSRLKEQIRRIPAIPGGASAPGHARLDMKRRPVP